MIPGRYCACVRAYACACVCVHLSFRIELCVRLLGTCVVNRANTV